MKEQSWKYVCLELAGIGWSSCGQRRGSGGGTTCLFRRVLMTNNNLTSRDLHHNAAAGQRATGTGFRYGPLLHGGNGVKVPVSPVRSMAVWSVRCAWIRPISIHSGIRQRLQLLLLLLASAEDLHIRTQQSAGHVVIGRQTTSSPPPHAFRSPISCSLSPLVTRGRTMSQIFDLMSTVKPVVESPRLL